MKLRAEEQLMIRCTPAADPENVKQTATLIGEGSFSWEYAIRLCHWHRMSGMLFAYLRENFPPDLWPESYMDDLRSHYRHTSVRAMYIRTEFAKAIKTFQAEGIEAIALKGVALLDSVYTDTGTREMSDIDLLVRPEFAERAQEIVTAMGYEPVGDVSPDHKHLPRVHSHKRELSFEIHTHMVSAYNFTRFDVDAIWEHAVPVELHGVNVLVPAPEHMLIHLCLHFLLDRRFSSLSGLRQLHDVSLVIRDIDHPIDWDFLLSEIQRHGLESPIHSVLSVVSKLMHADVPAYVLEALRPADYSEKMEELFTRQRVLETNPITATELVSHQSRYTIGIFLKNVFRRIAPSSSYMEDHYSEAANKSTGHSRLKRFGELFQKIFEYARNPVRLWQEVQVDKWLHSLSSNDASSETDNKKTSRSLK